MPTTMETLGIDQLNPEEQLELIGEIWDSLTVGNDFAIPESHKQELDRRLDSADAGVKISQPWEEVRARLRGEQ